MNSSDAKGTSTDSRGSYLRHIRLEHLYAGVSGGVISTLVLHPLDLVKIRFQVHEGQSTVSRPQYRGVIHAMHSIVKNNGFWGLYQGVTPNIWGAGISWGFYFFLYNSMKTWMQDGDSKKNLGAGWHMFIASVAGFGTLTITNPIWVTKTRLCLQYENAGSQGKPLQNATQMYLGMSDALVKIYRMEGLRGLYKGFIPGVFGISHGAFQFVAYEELKTLYNQYRQQPIDSRLSSGEYIVFAALSKIFAATLTYPYQVVRSRLQDQHRHYNGVMDVVRQVVRYEGWYGFYKGLLPCVLRVTPACAITFVVYEKIITLHQTYLKT
ncbi:mitochondrial folate transporter/carrier-like isoform X2 [Pomacea canaliculata]|uniref:mitochondrial folate transporter/carrier-like isoform X2 n=1 Tax=Pomacea canaliculata TaxID=400727 RepID=UPI000D731D5F|nr:mitochondrial folate transporter/carrier-like isoform X2 [Pomacea canaliculata]